MPDTPSLPVLVVDDDEPTQKLLQAVLRRSGFTAEFAGDGRRAIDLLESRAYVAVILDVMMPAVSGRAVVEFLSSSGRSVPVVICSAAGLTALTDFDPAVVKAVVRKPFDVEELMTAVRAAIGSE
jgi:two-component system, chemotaxis family, chemotaxis protein CheY